MMYKTRREKIKDLIEKEIIPAINEKDLDYNLVVSEIVKEISCSNDIVIEALKTYIEKGEMQEIRILTLPKSTNLVSWLQERRNKQKAITEEINLVVNVDGA